MIVMRRRRKCVKMVWRVIWAKIRIVSDLSFLSAELACRVLTWTDD